MRKPVKPRKCRQCKGEYTPRAEWQKFCSADCRNRTWNDRRVALLRRAQRIIDAQEVAK